MRIASILAASLVIAQPLAAQGSELFDAEIRPFIGVYIPATEQRDNFGNATMLGVQTAIELSPWAHLVGSLGWTHAHAKVPALSDDLTYIWQYDGGVEFNLIDEIDEGWSFRPFLGAGAGGRTYAYRAQGIGTRTCAAGYGTAGAQLERRTIAFRLEGRSYLSCFESPITGDKHTRGDFAVSFGLVYHFR